MSHCKGEAPILGQGAGGLHPNSYTFWKDATRGININNTEALTDLSLQLWVNERMRKERI